MGGASLWQDIRHGGALLRTDQPGRFTLRFVKQNQRITFAVKPQQDGQWDVTQIQSEPSIPPSPRKITFDAPLLKLRLRDRILLPPIKNAAPPDTPPIAINEVAVRPNGTILQIDAPKGIIHLYDKQGRLQGDRPSVLLAKYVLSHLKMQASRISPGLGNTFFIWSEQFDSKANSMGQDRRAQSAAERAQVIKRRPDGTWLGDSLNYRGYVTATMAPDGSLALLEAGRLSLYSARNRPERLIALPSTTRMEERMAYDGKQAVLLDENRLYSYGRDGKARWQCLLPAKPDALRWTPFLTESGRTLCLFDGRHSIYRYALP